MLLNYKHYHGQGTPMLILHGLYGNQANWTPLARQLAPGFNVYVLDARNHGQSAWADTMRFREMAADVAETMRSLGLAKAHVIGHSMGGKTAMLLALTQPELVQSLCVVDIAPVAYPRTEDEVMGALLQLDLASIRSRTDADAILAGRIPVKAVRDFLLTNLQRNEEGNWGWRFNLPVLATYVREVIDWPAGLGKYEGPVLFIKGERSDYILPEHKAMIRAHFPAARVETVAQAGHWVHSEKADTVLRLIRQHCEARAD
jgi:pimeloyl-ACP methyl ester carboxylesterase